MSDTSTTTVERMAASMDDLFRNITKIDDLKSNEAEMLRDLAKERDAARAENERLTKERDESNACNRGLVRLNEAVVARAEKAEAERDEARAEHRFTLGLLDKAMAERDAALALLADAYGAGTGGSVIEAHLADAERNMRQRAADKVRNAAAAFYPYADDGVQALADDVLALPLKHADRENGAALAQGQKDGRLNRPA